MIDIKPGSITTGKFIETSNLPIAIDLDDAESRIEARKFVEVGQPNELYYKLDSLTATDYSGKNRTGTVINAVLQQSHPFKVGNSLYFDGTGDYVATQNAIQFNPVSQYKGLTFSWWMKSGIEISKNIFGFDRQQNISPFFRVSMNRSTILTTNDINILYTDGAIAKVYSPINILTPNIWYNISIVFDFTNKKIIVYRNGIFYSQYIEPVNILFPSQADTLYIGSAEISGGAGNFIGNLSEFKIFDRTLSADEIAFNYYNDISYEQNMSISIKSNKVLIKKMIEYNSSIGVAGDVVSYRLNSLNPVLDYSGKALIATATNCEIVLDNPIDSNGYSIELSSANLSTITTNELTSLLNTNYITIKCYVKFYDNNIISQSIFRLSSAGNLDLYLTRSNGGMILFYNDSETTYTNALLPDISEINAWVKLKLTINYITGIAELYKDDVKIYAAILITPYIHQTGLALYVGHYNGVNQINGCISNFNIYNSIQ